mgnify:CR=1 FL=1
MKKVYNKNLYSNKISDQKIKEIIDLFKTNKIKPTVIDDQKIVYKCKAATVTIFKTKSILVQGENTVTFVKKTNLPFVQFERKNGNKINLDEYIGCDECGVGDYFGGITAAAVYIDKATALRLKKLGVTDSKKLDDNQILELAQKIKAFCVYNVTEFSPKYYNDYCILYKNQNVVKTLAHNLNIVKLQSLYMRNHNNERTTVVMDQYCDEKTYDKYLNDIQAIANLSIEHVNIFQTKAESKYIGVAAASILAREAFIKQMDQLTQQVNKLTGLKLNTLPLGSTNKSKIANIISKIEAKDKGKSLNKFIKMNFKSAKE